MSNMYRPRLRTMILWLCIPAFLAGACSKKETAEAPEPTSHPKVTFIEPQDGYVTAETLRVYISVESSEVIDRVILLVDGESVATRWEPPWSFAWCLDEIHDSSWVAAEAVAYDTQGRVGRSPEISILLVPNESPLVTILYPYPDHHIPAARLEERPWTCLAIDPDEGELGGDLITWSEEGRQVLGTGSQIVPAPLGSGVRFIQVEARDSWGRRVVDRQRVVIFDYPEENEPTDILSTYELAFRAREMGMLSSLLHSDFRLLSCTATGSVNCRQDGALPAALHRQEVLAALSSLLEDPDLHLVGWTWQTTSAELLETQQGPLAKAELEAVDLVLKRWDEGSLETLASRGNRVRLYLRKEDSVWKIWEWLVLPSWSPYPEDPDLYSLLARHISGINPAG